MPRSLTVSELRAILTSQDGIASAESLELPVLRAHNAIQASMPAGGVRRFESGLSQALARAIALLNDEHMEAALLWHFGIAEGSGFSTPQLRRARAVELSTWGTDAYGKDRWNARTQEWDKCRLTRALERIEIYLSELAEPVSSPAANLDGATGTVASASAVAGPRRYDGVAEYARALTAEVDESTTLSYLGPSPLDGARLVLARRTPYRTLRLLWVSIAETSSDLLQLSLGLTELELSIPVTIARAQRRLPYTVHAFESAVFVEASTRANSTAIFEALRFEAGTRQADRLLDLIEDCARDASATTLLPSDDYVAIGRKLAGLAGKTQASAER